MLPPDRKLDTEIVALSIDAKPELQMMVDRIAKEGKAPDFPFVSDSGHRVIDRYGLLNAADKRGIPHPTVYLIDKRGVVRWKFTEVNYKVRPTNAMILEALAAIP